MVGVAQQDVPRQERRKTMERGNSCRAARIQGIRLGMLELGQVRSQDISPIFHLPPSKYGRIECSAGNIPIISRTGESQAKTRSKVEEALAQR